MARLLLTGIALMGLAATAGAIYHKGEPGGDDNTDRGATGGVAAVVRMTSALTFEPDKLAVRVGDIIEWRNVSEYGHTITADPRAYPGDTRLPEGAAPFDFPADPGEAVRYVFDQPGTYRYICIPHLRGGMVGTIEVLPAN